MPHRCTRCDSTHDSRERVAQHAWKSKDDDHEDVESLEEGHEVAEQFSLDGESPDDEPSDGGSSNGDPTLSDGPPDVPDDEPDDHLEEAPCGCEVDTRELEDGQTYRCTDHNVRFTYHA